MNIEGIFNVLYNVILPLNSALIGFEMQLLYIDQ